MDASPEPRHRSSFKIDKIEHKKLRFHEKLGEGGFGAVHRVTFNTMFKNQFKGYREAAAKSVMELEEREIEIMGKLHHQNIVKLIGFSEAMPVTLILMECAPNGSLHNFLADSSKLLPDKLKNRWFKESALAIQYLHDQNFLHRDIKPKNCLLFEDYHLKLCDFGLARAIERSQTTSERRGTNRYMAPELHVLNENGRAVYSKPADVYAYGMLVLEIITRIPPFYGWEPHKVVYEVGNGAQPDIPEDCPSHLSQIMGKCWNTDPKQRPKIASIIETLQEEEEEDKVMQVPPVASNNADTIIESSNNQDGDEASSETLTISAPSPLPTLCVPETSDADRKDSPVEQKSPRSPRLSRIFKASLSPPNRWFGQRNSNELQHAGSEESFFSTQKELKRHTIFEYPNSWKDVDVEDNLPAYPESPAVTRVSVSWYGDSTPLNNPFGPPNVSNVPRKSLSMPTLRAHRDVRHGLSELSRDEAQPST